MNEQFVAVHLYYYESRVFRIVVPLSEHGLVHRAAIYRPRSERRQQYLLSFNPLPLLITLHNSLISAVSIPFPTTLLHPIVTPFLRLFRPAESTPQPTSLPLSSPSSLPPL